MPLFFPQSLWQVITDPIDGSWVYNPDHPAPDPNITMEQYERTEEENDDLGLTQMWAPNPDDNDAEDVIQTAKAEAVRGAAVVPPTA